MQANWIGRSEGVEIGFDISQYGLEQTEIRTFTTRIDTIYGVTFIVMAPEHPLVQKLVTENHRDEVEKYIDQSRRQTEVERLSTEHEKTGVFIGSFAINHLNGEGMYHLKKCPTCTIRPRDTYLQRTTEQLETNFLIILVVSGQILVGRRG